MCRRIRSFTMQNVGTISKLSSTQTGAINLFIGENGTGKTTVLKMLFASARAAEDCGRGDEARSFGEILADNLRWTFQVNEIGEIVKKGTKKETASKSLVVKIATGNDNISFSFGASTASTINSAYASGDMQEGTSIFLPSREIFSIQNIILQSRERDKLFGFDNAYYELAKALRIPAHNADSIFGNTICKMLEKITDGTVEYDKSTAKWYYRNRKGKYSINITSEGVKKVAMLEQLILNGSLTEHSILFIDEPEASLHPDAITHFLDIIAELAIEHNIQVFMASHSYFVIKKLRLIALKEKCSVPCISLGTKGIDYSDLCEEMPDNSIIRESVRLYEEEINEVLG